MLNAAAIALHILSVVVWVGGMFFAYMCLRPAAGAVLEPPQRLRLWSGTFARFFPWVWASVLLLPLTGYWMAYSAYIQMKYFPVYVHVMQGLGIVMIMIYLHVFFAPYRRLRRAVDAEDWQAGGRSLNQIRMLVGLNLILGIAVVVAASAGRYLPG